MNKIQNILDFVKQNLNIIQIYIINQINRYRKNVTFKVSDIIFLNNKNINTKRLSRKLNYKKYNFFKVLKLIKFLYKLKLFTSIRIYNVFHANILSLTLDNSFLK